MDISQFANDSLNGVPIILVVMGLTTLLQEIGVQGMWQRISSLVIGLLFGGAYQYAVSPPSDFAGWLGLVVYGLAMGLTATGLYETAKKLVAARRAKK